MKSLRLGVAHEVCGLSRSVSSRAHFRQHWHREMLALVVRDYLVILSVHVVEAVPPQKLGACPARLQHLLGLGLVGRHRLGTTVA